MNKKAKELGCENSNFTNPSGLPDKDMYSTARDMAKIADDTFATQPDQPDAVFHFPSPPAAFK